MIGELNLLPSQAKFQAAKLKLKKKANLFMVYLGVVWTVLALTVYGFWFLSSIRQKNYQNKHQQVIKSFQQIAENVSISQKLKADAKLVGKVLNSRFEYGESIKKINQIFSDRIVITNFEMKQNRQFLVSGVVNDEESMDEVESKISDINSGKMGGFASSKLVSLSIKSDGNWYFVMEVILK